MTWRLPAYPAVVTLESMHTQGHQDIDRSFDGVGTTPSLEKLEVWSSLTKWSITRQIDDRDRHQSPDLTGKHGENESAVHDVVPPQMLTASSICRIRLHHSGRLAALMTGVLRDAIR